jgi:hypothetical protein
MTTSTKGTALVTGASSGIAERDPARNRPLSKVQTISTGDDGLLRRHGYTVEIMTVSVDLSNYRFV